MGDHGTYDNGPELCAFWVRVGGHEGKTTKGRRVGDHPQFLGVILA